MTPLPLLWLSSYSSSRFNNFMTSWVFTFLQTNTQLEIYLKETNIKKATLEFEEVARDPIFDSRRKDYCCLCWCFCCSCDWYW